MKAPVGLLSDRTVLRSKMEGPRPDKFAFAKRSAAMKSPVGTLSDRTVLRSKMEGLCPDKFQFVALVPGKRQRTKSHIKEMLSHGIQTFWQ